MRLWLARGNRTLVGLGMLTREKGGYFLPNKRSMSASLSST
jgi:hypothetical protein